MYVYSKYNKYRPKGRVLVNVSKTYNKNISRFISGEYIIAYPLNFFSFTDLIVIYHTI